MEELSVEEILLKQKHVTHILVPQFLHQLMEDGVPGHPGLLVIKAVMVDLGQERKIVIIQSQRMVGGTVLEKFPQTQKVATSVTVRSMGVGAPGHLGVLVIKPVEVERRQERKGVTTHALLLEDVIVPAMLPPIQNNATQINVQSMEPGALGNPGLLAVCPVEVEFRQERKSVTTHALLLEDATVQAMLPLIQSNATQINVQSMEAGALGNPGLLAVSPVEVELRQERKSVTTHALLLEDVTVQAMLLLIHKDATHIDVW